MDREQVTIKWGVVKGSEGWEPFVSTGRQGPGWTGFGRLDKDQAIALAQQSLADHVSRYGGDWKLILKYQEWAVVGDGIELKREAAPTVLLTE